MEPPKKEKAKRYHQSKINAFFCHFLISLLFLYFFVQWGGAHIMRDWAIQKSPSFWVQALWYASVLYGILFLLGLPISYVGDYALEKRFGLSNLTFLRWIFREWKKAVLGLLFFLLMVLTGYVLIFLLKEMWWMGLGVVWFFYTWIFMQLFPTWIVPLFFKYTNVRDQKLVKMLKAFAERQGRTVESVRVLDLSRETKKANAAVLGIGKRKKIVLGDTLLKHFTHDEIKVVFAHELGHDKERHLLISLGVNALFIFGGIYLIQRILMEWLSSFGIVSLQDFAALPLFLFLFSLFQFVSMPFQNGLSRILERRADAFALRTTGMKKVFIASMKKLAHQNLADEEPHWLIELFFHSHPSIARRVKFAEKY